MKRTENVENQPATTLDKKPNGKSRLEWLSPAQVTKLFRQQGHVWAVKRAFNQKAEQAIRNDI
jgi:hypothetical protein